MNIEFQKAVLEYARKIEELDKEKEKAKSDLLLKAKGEKNIATTDFIDWYYWETNFSLEMLSEITGILSQKLAKETTRPKLIPYACIKCKGTLYHPCNNRSEVTKFLNPKNIKKNKDEYICEQCKEKARIAEEEKRIKKIRAKEEKAKEKVAFLRSIPYEEYLQTSHWKKFANERRRSVGYKCEKCKRDDLVLQVHHLTYERRGYERPSDVIVLCEACHKIAHNKPVPKYMIKNPVSLRDRAMQAIGK